jgi:hypothetical protein
MTAIDQRFDRLELKIDELREEMRAGFAEMRAEFSSLRNVLLQAALGMVGVLLAACVALVIGLS